jgi:hypothetical protein
MAKPLSRFLLTLSALILAAGGLMHARAFDRTLAAIASSDLAPFYANSLKALWLIDSATLFTLAVVFGTIAARPSSATRLVVLLLAAVPAATALFLYKYIGNFVPAHLLLAAAVAAALGGLGLGSGKAMDPGARS